MRRADGARARFALVEGPDEAAAGTVMVKDMASGAQTAIARADLVAELTGRLAPREGTPCST